ncbi:DUF4360 domain-containing protein [Actinomadura sp. NEAU-AAG7]|uniref:DUF4360 domain-containing protein n=1 Tax=Actinomadura sp. NEAU-AAG7 TaxID=2839640 RepID=UPI001BE47551|nr:DUF4360 domain-containing protein [Actinomadura sp. NEAU-AAG7]MBT2213438.1 DUF4360 domain-containing protein [Actinomadura sp. NEAU-AAG7]
MRKGIAISATALAALGVTAAPTNANASRTVPPPEKVTITVGSVIGSGCPTGTTAFVVSPDREAFTVAYSAYTAQAGGNSQPTDGRKNCQIALSVHVPQGFTYAIASTDHRGYASLQPGAVASQLASYYFQGLPKTTYVEHPIPTGLYGNWQFTDAVEIPQLVYKPCGVERYFNINTELRVAVGTSDASKVSFVAMDSTDGDLRTTYHFSWKTCPKTK